MKTKIYSSVVLGMALLSLHLGAQTWNATRRLTWNASNSYDPVVAADSSNHILVVWSQYVSVSFEVYYRKSADGGVNWMPAKRLTWNSGSSSDAALTIDSSGRIYVFWQDETPGNREIFYRRSTNGGVSWTATNRLTWNLGQTRYPALATDSTGNLHVVWQDDTPGNNEIYYRKSTDGGASWAAAKRLTWTSGSSSSPDIAIDSSGHIHIVWHDSQPGNVEIFYRRSTNGGVSWASAKRLSWNSSSSYAAALASDSGGNIHVVWQDDTPGYTEIFYRRSTDGGVSWTATKRLTWSSLSSNDPEIAVDSSGNLHVVWYDFTPGNKEIFYRRSTDGGVSWEGAKRLTWNSGGSSYPAVATDSNTDIHVVWNDNTPGTYEIYYRKGIQ